MSSSEKRPLWTRLSPNEFAATLVQWRHGALMGTILLYVVGFAAFLALAILNYTGARNNSYISADGSSWSQECDIREPVSQVFLLSKNGTWSNQEQFAYSEALLEFEVPQGYELGGTGFKQSLNYFSGILTELKANASSYDWPTQLLIASARKWVHSDTGITMRFTANPQYMLSYSFALSPQPQFYFQNILTGNSSNCGASSFVDGPYFTFSWYDPGSATCEAFGDISSREFYSFKFDVRSAIVVAANNVGLINVQNDLEKAVGYDILDDQYTVYHDPHYEGMQTITCFTDGSCGLQVYQDQWYYLTPYLYHYCQWFTDCTASCYCDPVDTSDNYCKAPNFVLVFFVTNSTFQYQDELLIVRFYNDFTFPMNEFAFRFQFPNCSSEQLVPSTMLNSVEASNTFDSGMIDTYFVCKRSVAYSIIYGISTSLSVASAIFALMLILIPLALKRMSPNQITFDQTDYQLDSLAHFKKDHNDSNADEMEIMNEPS